MRFWNWHHALFYFPVWRDIEQAGAREGHKGFLTLCTIKSKPFPWPVKDLFAASGIFYCDIRSEVIGQVIWSSSGKAPDIQQYL